MTTQLLILISAWLGFTPAIADPATEIFGRWQYDGFLYESHRYPNPNPDLVLIFEFYEDGTNTLRWSRENGSEFCERRANYRVENFHLLQKVTWINPDNSRSCASDPEMRMGPETDTVYSQAPGELWFHFDLNGKPFYYILKSIP